MPFFVKQYNKYITEHPNSNLIFVDFAKLKRINDEFTHQGGNDCLSSFGTILKQIFSDSLTVRKHGDEFLILTKHSYEEITMLFDKSKEMIQNHFDIELIPVIYGFNAGVVRAEHGINPTIEKADIMMYEAKRRNLTVINYDDELYNKVKYNQKFIRDTSTAIKENQLGLSSRIIYDAGKNPTNIIDVHTRDINNESLFSKEKLELLEKSSELKKLDYLNLKNIILQSVVPVGKKIMINIHANSLFNARTPFPRFINALYSSMDGNPQDYIISVNVNSFRNDIDELIIYLRLLKELNFEIALSSFDLTGTNPLLNIWSKVDTNYIKISNYFWKNAQTDPKYNSILRHSVPSFHEMNTKPIFMKVENEEDLNYIYNLSPHNLIEGNIVDKEQRSDFKKRK